MTLAYVERYFEQRGCRTERVMFLPRKRGESRIDYARRFFSEIQGLGNVKILYGKRVIARRGMS